VAEEARLLYKMIEISRCMENTVDLNVFRPGDEEGEIGFNDPGGEYIRPYADV
jgi:hypothetical protein